MGLLMTCNLVKEDFVAELVEAGLDEKCVGVAAASVFWGSLAPRASRAAAVRAA
jgi:hypothetical protein